jgi:superfamily II DNA/RNA helicase
MKSQSFVLSSQITALLEAQGITVATPVQEEIIPAIANGQDVLTQSETGSGKTLSFAIPIIEQLQRRDGLKALVLVPTRELAVQVAGEFVKYSAGKHLGIVPVYGGVSINTQASKMRQANIIVATPGRLIDLMNRNAVNLNTIKYFVCDEADRMLDMGFIKDVERIARQLPPQHQTMLFSATVSKEIEKLAGKYLHNPKNVRLASTVKPIFLRQTYYRVSPEKKLDLLADLLEQERHLAIIFCNRKHITVKVAKKLSSVGIHARALNGDMSQPQREKVTDDFRKEKFTVLVATDVAARGLHIDDVSHVYNYEIPKDVESYTHRVGRTARAGQKGEAVSLVATEEERKFFQQILFKYRGEITLKESGEIKVRSHQPAQPAHEEKSRKPEAQPWKNKWRRRQDDRSGRR